METLNSDVDEVKSLVTTETSKVPTPLATATAKAQGLEIIELPQLSEFLDYRKYLASYYHYRRAASAKDIRQYNYAVFSAAADIKSPNYLKMIIEGKRNLSDDMILKFAKALALNKEQTEEFRLLVLFTQSNEPAERNLHLKDLNENRVRTKLRAGEIDQKAWDKVPGWISWILFSMIDQENVSFDANKLRTQLRGLASADEIAASMKALVANGQAVHDEATATLKKTTNMNESNEEIPVALVRKLQSELMYLGMESLFRDAPTEREFGSVTLALTKQEFEDLKFQLRKFRKQTQKDIAVKRTSTKGERVYQMNLQLFPVTDKA